MLYGFVVDSESEQPLSAQLRKAMSDCSARVIDVFREWDSNGDGNISSDEFRAALPTLGLEVPRVAADAIFDQVTPVT